jgi:hypothetical protein
MIMPAETGGGGTIDGVTALNRPAAMQVTRRTPRRADAAGYRGEKTKPAPAEHDGCATRFTERAVMLRRLITACDQISLRAASRRAI